jgi:molecular chaperone GrpE
MVAPGLRPTISANARKPTSRARNACDENFSSDLVAVGDSLEAALAADKVTIESLKSGVELTLKQLNAVFEKNCITEINPADKNSIPTGTRRSPRLSRW